MKKSLFLKIIDSYDDFVMALKNEKDIFNKISDEYMAENLTFAKFEFLKLEKESHSYIISDEDFVRGVANGFYQYYDEIQKWIDSEEPFFIINPKNVNYSEDFLLELEPVGYNLKSSSKEGSSIVETYELFGNQTIISQTEKDINIENVEPNESMVGSYPVSEDPVKEIKDEYAKLKIEGLSNVLNKNISELDELSEKSDVTDLDFD